MNKTSIKTKVFVYLQAVKLMIKMKITKKVTIMSIEETLEVLKNEHKSICRFGDGEMNLILNRKIGFQSFNAKLANRLQEILSSRPDNCIIGVPDAINNLSNLNFPSFFFG